LEALAFAISRATALVVSAIFNPLKMWQDKAYYIILVLLRRLAGLGLVAFSFVAVLALFSFDMNDPSFNAISSDEKITNWMGQFGSHVADLLFQLIGLASFFLCLIFFSVGLKMLSRSGVKHLLPKLILIPFCILCFSTFFASIAEPDWWAFNSFGGVNGAFILAKISFLPSIVVALLALFFGIILMSVIMEISISDWIYSLRYAAICARLFGEKLFQITKNMFARDVKFLPRKNYVSDEEKDISSLPRVFPVALTEPEEKKVAEVFEEEDDEADEDDEDENEDEDETKESLKQQLKKAVKPVIKKSGTKYQLPQADLLIDRSAENKDKKTSKAQIDAQSKTLTKVLEDFGVYGNTLGAKVGPVVTLHEFEPAAGTKASRVIGLSDDIARSMSAVSARIATIPGRTSIGMELPNLKREMIFLREMIESKEYKSSQNFLPMILGKNIGGEPVIADLAKMPHLLIAGTTGSGKSVGLNVMILSLLFKMRPDECKFIMIDPKMLELSVYDGIPHLLAPVVTEPGKAVIALKWVTNEMEERYRLMSSFAVRNIAGYNEKAEKAILSGEKLSRKVQVGYNPENGKPIIEEIEFEPKKLPFIVVIVDEMADLMLVAGKEIENSVQRLAQMARAAGIHIIMATQRPSVDVITGVIKANFPTRISFQVTSRIDSRTILGAQGAEQLLGQGDMIYMSGGSKMIRVHGPFCSDAEIEKIVKFIKDQDLSEFEESESINFETVVAAQDSSGGDDADGGGSDNDLYKKAVAIVRRDKKPSISYVQRQLRIGYNRAAILIEKMEAEGVVSAPNVSGKREIIEQ